MPPRYSNNSFASAPHFYPVEDAFYKPSLSNETDKTTEQMLVKRRKQRKVTWSIRFWRLHNFDSIYRSEQRKTSENPFDFDLPFFSYCLAFQLA